MMPLKRFTASAKLGRRLRVPRALRFALTGERSGWRVLSFMAKRVSAAESEVKGCGHFTVSTEYVRLPFRRRRYFPKSKSLVVAARVMSATFTLFT